MAFAATIGDIVLLGERTKLSALLETTQAVAATGPCGDKFIVVLSEKGSNVDRSGTVVVAGRVLPAESASNYYYTPSPSGDEVWKKDESGQNPTLVFRRAPAGSAGCPACPAAARSGP